MQLLQEYIKVKEIFCGPITEIEVTQEVLDWYDEQRKLVAKNLSIPTTKNYKVPKYLNVELKKIS